MDETARTPETPPDKPFLDTTPDGSRKGDSVNDVTENAATTHHKLAINGMSIPYTATAGHLVTTDLYSARPVAKIFYVAFTADGATASNRPVTFFYNGAAPARRRSSCCSGHSGHGESKLACLPSPHRLHTR